MVLKAAVLPRLEIPMIIISFSGSEPLTGASITSMLLE